MSAAAAHCSDFERTKTHLTSSEDDILLEKASRIPSRAVLSVLLSSPLFSPEAFLYAALLWLEATGENPSSKQKGSCA